MRRFVNAVVACLVLLGCGSEHGDPAAPPTEGVTFDLRHYDGDAALFASNRTLLFPLRKGDATFALSRSSPGDLEVLYTRVGCWIDDPGRLLGSLTPIESRHLASISIEIVRGSAGPREDLEKLARDTCFTYRTPDGAWHSLLAPTRVAVTESSAIAELSLDVPNADAVAIFLPTWVNIARVSYAGS